MKTESETEEALRQRALKRLQSKRDFYAHLLAYLTINGLLVAIWWMTGGGFFWPVIPLFAWGLGLLFHAWDVYVPGPSEEAVRREMEHLRRT